MKVTNSQRRYLSAGSEEGPEASTLNIVSALRAALAFEVKQAVGADVISARESRIADYCFEKLRKEASIVLLGRQQTGRLPIISFIVQDMYGRVVPHGLVCTLLNDLFGVQARPCCAGEGEYPPSFLKSKLHDLI